MIPRYSLPEMEAVFSDESRFGRWVEIELLATEAHSLLGVVPTADAVTCRANTPVIDPGFINDVLEREKITDHDVAASAAGTMPKALWASVANNSISTHRPKRDSSDKIDSISGNE